MVSSALVRYLPWREMYCKVRDVDARQLFLSSWDLYASGMEDATTHVCFKTVCPTCVLSVCATGGRLSQQLLASSVEELRRSNLLCYVCGPPTMIEWTVEQLQQLKLGDEQILYEKWW